jgi:hypothetical protein
LGATPSSTVLERATSATNMMEIQVPNVTITNLQFDGTKSSNYYGYVDLLLTGNNIIVYSVNLTNAYNYSMQIVGNNVTVMWSYITSSRDCGIISWDGSRSFSIHDNQFENNGGGAMSIFSFASAYTPSYIQANTFFNNHSNPPAPNDYGGQICLNPSSAYIRVVNNWFDGNWANGNGTVTCGIETYGTQQYFEGNMIFDHFGAGMALSDIITATILGGQNGWAILDNGIAIRNSGGGNQSTSGVTITGIRSSFNGRYGIAVHSDGNGSISGIVIQNSVSVTGNGRAPYQVCASYPDTTVASDVNPVATTGSCP